MSRSVIQKVYIDGLSLYSYIKAHGLSICKISEKMGCDPTYLGLHARQGWLPKSKYEALSNLLSGDFSCPMPGRKYLKKRSSKTCTKGMKYNRKKASSKDPADYNLSTEEMLRELLVINRKILNELKKFNS